MTCDACGAQTRDGQKFCTNCGARLVLACPHCGAPADPGQRFCGQCGTALPGAEAPPSAPTAPAPAQMTPAPAPGYELQGERKQLTVLFADIKGSMDMQADLDPEEWAGIMDRFARLLADGVRRYDGMVDKFTGDGIMALFGAPIALEDHARRACLAALYLVEAIPRYAAELRLTRGLELHVRLGLNSGEAVVGRVGGDLRLDAVGPTVGLAQRMEAMAEPGRAYLTEYTARLVEGAFRLTDLGPTAVKGVRDPLRVFVLDGAMTRFQTTRHQSVGGLVGRHRELAVLEDALALAGEGQAQIVGVVGEAGVGKTRLCEEFCASVAQRGIVVRRTAGVSHGRNVPLLPVLSLVREYFDIGDTDTPAAIRAKVGERILGLAPELAEDLPLFFDFIEVPDPDTPAPVLAPEVRMGRVFQMLGRITASRSAEGMFVFLLEDLQWFDPQSVAFFERLVASLPGSRTLVLTNFRSEFTTDWMRQPFYRQLSLQPLASDAVGELLGSLLGVDLSLAPLAGFVAERTGGNPYFVQEVVRALLDNGTVTGKPGAYRLTCALDQVRIPPSVHAVVAARIDRLSPQQKTVLQTASVIGRTFSEPVLARVTDLSGDDLTQALRALCEAQLLEELSTATTEYRFWQALTQEVAYGTLLAARRRLLHAHVAEALAAHIPDRLDETAAILAWHWQRADRPLEAARWDVRAAGFALRSDIVDALRRFKAAVDLLDGIPETPESLALGVRARIRLLQFGARIGISAEHARVLYDEAQERAQRLGDVGLLGMSTIAYGATLAFAGDVMGGLARCRDAARLGEEAEDPEVRAALSVPLCFTLSYVGPLPEALAAADRVVEVCDGDEARGARILGHGVLARALQFRASILARMGRLPEASAALERSIEVARRRNESETLVWALSLFAQLPWLAGEAGDVGVAAEAVRIAEDSGNVTSLVLALRAQALSTLAAGDAGAAVAMCERALGEGRRTKSGLFEEAPVLAVLARARLTGGDAAGAMAAADEAVAVARAQRARVTEAQVLLARAHVRRAAAVAPADVRGDVEDALAVIEETGARMFEPFVREELARLDDDRLALAGVEAAFVSIGASGHARRLQAELVG
ncbi:MAG TPA: adenylate/guanylate cyclase domain-containing protein [Acidimicrobiales bacterium]|nr:adenylate/guanylate cyclase domain-containing protein [Acidimicrobiales bacterium]